MVGTKRTHPFSRDNQSGPSFPCKFPPNNVPPIARRDVSGSNFTRGTDNAEPSNQNFRSFYFSWIEPLIHCFRTAVIRVYWHCSRILYRESLSSSTLVSELYPRNVAIENGGNGDMNGDFLTLATHTTALPHSRSNHKFASANPTPPSRELCLPYQVRLNKSPLAIFLFLPVFIRIVLSYSFLS